MRLIRLLETKDFDAYWLARKNLHQGKHNFYAIFYIGDGGRYYVGPIMDSYDGVVLKVCDFVKKSGKGGDPSGSGVQGDWGRIHVDDESEIKRLGHDKTHKLIGNRLSDAILRMFVKDVEALSPKQGADGFSLSVDEIWDFLTPEEREDPEYTSFEGEIERIKTLGWESDYRDDDEEDEDDNPYSCSNDAAYDISVLLEEFLSTDFAQAAMTRYYGGPVKVEAMNVEGLDEISAMMKHC